MDLGICAVVLEPAKGDTLRGVLSPQKSYFSSRFE